MAKYVYPAVFKTEENGSYSIFFPDLPNCFTCGDSLKDGILMAEDALALTLYGYEKEQKDVPPSSTLSDISVEQGEFINYIVCDTMEYRKMYNNKAVKKTLTIPEWMNEEAIAAGLNFSQILQEALLKHLNLI